MTMPTENLYPYDWARCARIGSNAHIVGPDFLDTYRALCGASVYKVHVVGTPTDVCRKCRTEWRRREAAA